MVPGPYTLNGLDATPEGLLTWTLLNYKSIYWPHMPDGLSLRVMLLTELNSLKVKVDESSDSFDGQEAVKCIQRAIKLRRSDIHTRFYEGVVDMNGG